MKVKRIEREFYNKRRDLGKLTDPSNIITSRIQESLKKSRQKIYLGKPQLYMSLI